MNARGVHSLSAITRITFGIIDIERTLLPYFSLTAPIVRFQSDSNQIPIRFQSGSNGDEGHIRGKPLAYMITKIAVQRSCFFRLKVRGERLKAGILGLRSRRACAQVCAHARHANIIYILLRQWLYHQTSIGVGQETDIQLAVIDICAQSRHIQYQYLWLYTR